MAKSAKKNAPKRPAPKTRVAVKKAPKPKAKPAVRPAAKLFVKPIRKFKPSKVHPAYRPLLKKLQDRRNEILGQVDHLEKELRDDMSEVQSTPGDIADHGSGELNQHLSVTLMENDRVELDLIERALARFENSEYGQCESCGKVISVERLKAIPWATRCISCQSRNEGV
jgi:RNA polymerase-binding protein DksA